MIRANAWAFLLAPFDDREVAIVLYQRGRPPIEVPALVEYPGNGLDFVAWFAEDTAVDAVAVWWLRRGGDRLLLTNWQEPTFVNAGCSLTITQGMTIIDNNGEKIAPPRPSKPLTEE